MSEGATQPAEPLPSIAELIPHRGPMSLLDRIERFTPTGVVCRATIGVDCPFLRDGRVHAVVALELMAQAAAVWSGLVLRSESKAPRTGFLVSVPTMALEVEHLALGDELAVHAAPLFRGKDGAAFTCSVERDGHVMASATLTALAPAGDRREHPVKPRALVTGASRGIGAAIACELARAGHPIVLNFRRDEAAARAVASEIEAIGQPVELARFDVADRAAAAAALAELQRDAEPIGVIVNNAGVALDVPFGAMSEDAWDRVLATTLDGFYNVTRPLIIPMVSRRWGRIVNIASVSGIHGNRGQVNYAAAKAGLIGATRALALEVAKRGVTVNAVAPGSIETDMTTGLPLERVLEHIPMRRIGKAVEVARVVRFLCSDDASYITKQVIAVDGGLS